MDRDINGRFLNGHSPMGGRPSRPKEEQYYRILLTACSPKDWEFIIAKAIDQAKKGDAVARKWLTDYLVGPPIERKEITGLDAGPIIFKVIYDNA